MVLEVFRQNCHASAMGAELTQASGLLFEQIIMFESSNLSQHHLQ